jgi:hypothetical protein
MAKKENALTVEPRIKQHKKYPQMYWVKLPDGSKDFFSKTRALELIRRMDEQNATLDTK